MSTPTVLSPEECRHLLAGEVVGRVGLSTPKGPRIVPVNYAVHAEEVVFRTSAYSEVGTYGRNADVAFEVDRLDHERHQGWSVVVLGRSRVVDDPAELAEIRRTWEPRPWASGARNLVLAVPSRDLSGRRIGQDWDEERLTPYRRTV